VNSISLRNKKTVYIIRHIVYVEERRREKRLQVASKKE